MSIAETVKNVSCSFKLLETVRYRLSKNRKGPPLPLVSTSEAGMGTVPGPGPVVRGQESGLGVLAESPMPAQVEGKLGGPGQ